MNKTQLILTTLGVALIAGLIWIIASAPQTQAPQGAPETSQPSSPAPTPAAGTTPSPKPAGGGMSKSVPLYFVSPAGGEKWLIGQDHTISWTNAAQIAGEIALVQAGTNTVVGWINSSTGPSQTSYTWDTRLVSTTRGGGVRKEVAPGNYFLRIKFDAASYPVLTSGQIALTIVAQPIEGQSVTIQNYAFNPANTVIAHGGKVTFINNDSVPHNITFQASVYPASSLKPGESATINTSSFQPGTYNYYCSIHPSMKGVLTVQ